MTSKPSDIASAGALALHGDCLPLCELLWPGIVLDVHQIDLINCIMLGFPQVFAKGCTQSGKTYAAGIAANLKFRLNPECKIIFSSATYDHAKAVGYGEFCGLFKRCVFPMAADPGREGLFINEQRYVTIGNPATGEGFSGQHGPATLFILDECTAIADERFDLATTQGQIVALANPRTLSGWFRRGFPSDSPNTTQTIQTAFGPRRCITIDGADCLNVKSGKVLIPGQLTLEKYNGLCAHHDPRWVDIFAHGKFSEEDAAKQIIVGSTLPRHQSAWHNRIRVDCFGLDVAASDDGDATCLAAGSVQGVAKIHVWKKADTMQTVAQVISTARDVHHIDLKLGQNIVCVDCDGVGLGVADRLAEQGIAVIRFRGSETAHDPKTYANRRAEAWGILGVYLDPRGPFASEVWALPDDPMLAAELCAPERVYVGSDGVRFRITPKTRTGAGFDGDTLREKLGRSPDRADAVVYLSVAVGQQPTPEQLINTPPEQMPFEQLEGDWMDPFAGDRSRWNFSGPPTFASQRG